MKKFLALVLAAALLLSLVSVASAETPAWEPFAENVSITIYAISPNGYCYSAGAMGGVPVTSFSVEN